MKFFQLIRQRSLVYLSVFLIATLSQSAALAANSFPNGILWKVEYPGVPSSYLFGTIHIEDPRVTHLPAAVSKAFDTSNSLTLEINPSAGAMASVAQQMLYQDGRTLEHVLGKDLYQRTAAELKKHGIPPQMTTLLKPWAAMITLIAPQQKTGVFLDYALYLKSTEQGKTFYALETLDEQLSVFTQLTERDQVALLKDTLNQLPTQKQTFEELTQAYLARDLDKLLTISKEQMPSSPRLSERMDKRLVSDRNLRMYKRAQQQLGQ